MQVQAAAAVPSRVVVRHPRCQPRAAARVRLVVRAHAPEASPATGTPTFLDELRSYAMKLHTREQAPREGQAEAPKRDKPWAPTREGYLAFMANSKAVYDEFEAIFQEVDVPFYKLFCNTGLERGPSLQKDIAYMQQQYGLTPPALNDNSPGHTYAKYLRELAQSSPAAFMCHYYNHYFAHTAGGRMIGKSVSTACLDGWVGDFYKWDGDVKALGDAVRANINKVAEGWSADEKQACLEETPATFKWSGELLRLITAEHSEADTAPAPKSMSA